MDCRFKIGYNNTTLKVIRADQAIPEGWTWLVTDHPEIIFHFFRDKISNQILGLKPGLAEIIYDKWRDEHYYWHPFVHFPIKKNYFIQS